MKITLVLLVVLFALHSSDGKTGFGAKVSKWDPDLSHLMMNYSAAAYCSSKRVSSWDCYYCRSNFKT